MHKQTHPCSPTRYLIEIAEPQPLDRFRLPFRQGRIELRRVIASLQRSLQHSKWQCAHTEIRRDSLGALIADTVDHDTCIIMVMECENMRVAHLNCCNALDRRCDL